jgi:hypothetical protein
MLAGGRLCLAGVAQLVEQLICNQQVAGSSPIASSWVVRSNAGQVAKRSNATDCKSVGLGLRRFESFPAHDTGGSAIRHCGCIAGVTQLVESQPSKLLVAGSSPVSRSADSTNACVAQLVEHFLGKEEVTGSIPVASSRQHCGTNTSEVRS